jgi:signal peptidase II
LHHFGPDHQQIALFSTSKPVKKAVHCSSSGQTGQAAPWVKPVENEPMTAPTPMTLTPNRRIALVAALLLAADQLTKLLINHYISLGGEKVIVPGFFRLVHWGNTGAAWSLFSGRNGVLAIVAVVALVVLFRSRHHFDAHTRLGQFALGLIFGGIVGNFLDRVIVGHVTDFLYFYMDRRGGGEIGFPAFNLADSGICVGVALIFISSLKGGQRSTEPPPQPPS